MLKATDKIYIKEWLMLKPYDTPVPTDSYYLKLCNQIKHSMVTNKESLVLQMCLDQEEIHLLSCFLASYFEDVISGTNIWNTFVRLHQNKYGKPVPFFEIKEYFEEEINLQDVCFLIWYFMNTVQDERLYAPINDFILETAKKVMEVLDEAWDYAPENTALLQYYSIDEQETDYYKVRHVIDNILFKTYLFFPDTGMDLKESEYDILEEKEEQELMLNLLKENRDFNLQASYTRLFSQKGYAWAAELLGSEHPLYNDLLHTSKKIPGYFFYKGQDAKHVFFEHIASGKEFEVTKKSIDHAADYKELDSIVYMGIVKWQDEWWFSGVSVQRPYDADLVLDQKNSIESRMSVSFLDYKEQNMDGFLERQFEAFKELTGGSQIAFMESDKIGDFFQKHMESYNKSLNLSKKEAGKAEERAKAEGFFGGDMPPIDFSDAPESGLVFFNPSRGPEAALAVNSAFPAPNNPFFIEAESQDHILRLLTDSEASKELALYCIDNYKSELPFFDEPEGKIYLDNLDFLLRFWKKENYHTKPNVALTGLNQ